MEEKSKVYSELFDTVKDGKIVETESNIKWKFVRNYTIIALILFTIYKIIYNIFDMKFIEVINENFSRSNLLVVEDISKFVNILVNRSFIIFISSLIIILCNFLYTYISSFLIFRKNKVKKSYVKNIIKVISIIELIILVFIMFDISVDYINHAKTCSDLSPSFEKILEKYNSTDKDINMLLNKVYITDIVQFIILLSINICCTKYCIYWQKRIIERNSIE